MSRTPKKEAPRNLGRLWRMERSAEPELPVDEGHSWAVPYSDLLMVLMSFFIIFFNFQDQTPRGENVLSYLAISLKDGLGAERSTGPTASSAGGSSSAAGSAASSSGGSSSVAATKAENDDARAAAAHQFSKNLAALLDQALANSESLVSASLDPVRVTVELKGDVFDKRSYRIRSQLAERLDRILAVLEPKKDFISIQFMGHSDSAKVMPSHGDRLANNFELSALRAAAAVNYAMGRGFDPRQLFAQGVADNLGDARSLSIVIQAR